MKNQRITNDGDDKKEDYNDENDNYCPRGASLRAISADVVRELQN